MKKKKKNANNSNIHVLCAKYSINRGLDGDFVLFLEQHSSTHIDSLIRLTKTNETVVFYLSVKKQPEIQEHQPSIHTESYESNVEKREKKKKK